MKKYLSILAAGFFVLWGIQSFAAFQWGADLNQAFTWRMGMDLNDDKNNPVATRNSIARNEAFGHHSGDSEDFFTTLLGVNGVWTLVKDTSVTFRISSQFDWLGSNTAGPQQTSIPGAETDDTLSTATGTNPFSLWINQLYLSMNDFAGFPFSFKAGRQNVWLGKGFVLGNRLFGAGPTLYANGQAPSGSSNFNNTTAGANGQDLSSNMGNLPLNAISGGSLNAPETADYAGFDGVTGNFHFLDNKLNVDFGYLLVSNAMISSEDTDDVSVIRDLGSSDNETLTFANVGYKTKKWNAETYFMYNHDREPAADRQAITVESQETDKIITLGLRGDFDWADGMWKFKKFNTFGEFALQRGKLGASALEANRGRSREAFAWNAGHDMWLDVMWSPMIGVEAAWFSGMEPQHLELSDDTPDVPQTELWQAWDPQFRGRFFTKLSDFLDTVYLTDVMKYVENGDNGGVRGRLDAGFTNRLIAQLKTAFNPLKKTNIGITYSWFQAIKPPQVGSSKDLGFELDWDLGYELSSVTKWYLDGGVFFPGTYYDRMPTRLTPNTNIAGRGAVNAYMLRTGFKVNLG